jgi:hypothetical protein
MGDTATVEHRRHRRGSAIVACAGFVLGLALLCGNEVVAQSAPPSDWTFRFAPNVWTSGLEGTIRTRERIPPVEADANFFDILENLDIALMLTGEVRYKRFVFLTDVNYLKLSTDGGTSGPLFSGFDAENKTFFISAGAGYRVYDAAPFGLDVLAGLRFWNIDNKLTLNPGLLPKVTAGASQSWTDPIIGLRGTADLGSGFYTAIYTDIGGFGVASRFSWQIQGLVGYEFGSSAAAQIGYRHLSVDYRDGAFIWDVDLSGPLIGLSFRF